jgi:hypothetical protein
MTLADQKVIPPADRLLDHDCFGDGLPTDGHPTPMSTRLCRTARASALRVSLQDELNRSVR